MTWVHICAGLNRVLYVGVFAGTNAHTDADYVVTGVTYNGVAMSQVGANVHADGGSTGYIALYRLINPALGSHPVAVSYIFDHGVSLDALTGGSASFAGVSQTQSEQSITSAASSGASTPASVTQGSKVGNAVLVAVCAGDALSAPNQTSLWVENLNDFTGAGNTGMQRAPGATAVTATWAVAGPNIWAVLSIDIIAADVPVDYSNFPKTIMRNGAHL